MKRKRRGQLTAFYLETLIMIVIMIGILLVLTQVLGASRAQSARAKRLTEAVTVAQSVAEASAKTDNLSDLEYLLDLSSMEVTGEAGEDQTCSALWRWEHKTVDADANVQINYMETDYRVMISRVWENGMAKDHIEIRDTDRDTKLYSLDVETHMGGEEA